MRKINANKVVILFFVLIAISMISGCSAQNNNADKLFCTQDSDCICSGTDKQTNECFIGNKEYFAKNVDASKQCPDFCTGIAGNMKLSCKENKCQRISVKHVFGECSKDSDCIVGGCSGQICGLKEEVEGMITTCEYKEEYSCLKLTSCICINTKCVWKQEPVYVSCLEDKKN